MHNNNILCLRLHQEYILCILASMHSTLEYNNSYAYSRLVVCIDNRVEMCMKIILQEY